MAIVSLTGLIGSGKDTVADFLVENHGFERMSFAATLKDVAASVFSWDRELLDGRTSVSRTWREQVDPWWAARLNIPNLSPRWILQHLGTDVLRRHFHDDIWLASLERKLMSSTSNVVITDARFPNELSVIKQHNGTSILIKRGLDPEWYDAAARTNRGESNEMTFRSDIHPSEWKWVGSEFDYTVHNDLSIDDLYTEINNIASKV